MRALRSLLLCLLGILTIAANAAAETRSIAVAADDNCIAVNSDYVERRLLRARFDPVAGKVAFSLFGPPGIETFAVAPKGAFVVYAGMPGSKFEQTPHLFLLDAAGKPTGKPIASPIGAVADLAVSPKGDWVAASSDRGWISLFAVERAGPTMRLVARATFGVSADRAFTYAFRPDGGLVTMTEDWVAVFRTPDGAIQRVLDLKTGNRGLEPIGREISGLFRLRWSPRGDRFTVNWGSGPMFTKIFDATGRYLNPADLLPGTEVEYIDGGDAAIVFGMTEPVVVRMAGLAAKPFGGPEINATHRLVALSGGRRILTLDRDRAALWSSEGKQLIAPTGFLNYGFVAAAAGADGEAIITAVRAGWVDLFTKQGEFVRRIQFGLSGSGTVAVSADGTLVTAFDGSEISTLIRPTAKTWHAKMPGSDFGHQMIAIPANGSRVVAAGPDNTVRIWSREGDDLSTYKVETDGPALLRPHDLAVSPDGDTIVVTNEEAAWFVWPADGRVRRVALPGQPRVVVPLAQGFAFGLADGRIVRLSRDGSPEGEPIKGSEFRGVGDIAVADDGESFMVVEDDQIAVRQLDWDGRVLAGPFRSSPPDLIRGAFFEFGRAMLILSESNESAGDGLALKPLLDTPAFDYTYFEPPR